MNIKMNQKKFGAQNWNEYVPIPVCEEFPQYEEFYFRAWELAYLHIKHMPGMPQTPYMDEGFCDTLIWIWDTCFMSLFSKYAQQVFPGVETYNNFYHVLYDGKSLPKIIPSETEPKWTHAVPGVPIEIRINIADNPPLFAWGEYENALISGDIAHIKELLYEKQYLQKYYDWFENLKTNTQPHGVFLETCLIAEDIGYRWEGGCSGMDNTPRGRNIPHEGKERPNNPDLLWIDAICQQAMEANMISKLFKVVEDEENAALWQGKYLAKKDIVNKYYWDNEDKFYYDINISNHDFCKVMTIASFWPLIAEIASKEQADALLSHALNPQTFGGVVPLVSLARNDGDFYADGHYWRGGFWLPTAYMALKGLSQYQYHEEVQLTAHKILKYILKTYQNYEPHSIWECYAPEGYMPGHTACGDEVVRKDFCGWSALGPISIYIEFVLGFHTVNAFERVVEWALPKCFTGEIGIKNLHFGNIITDIVEKDGVCLVASNREYTLKIDGKPFAIRKGMQEFYL